MYLLTGSITTAARLARAIEQISSYPADVIRTPPQIRSGGCSYSVRFDDRALDIAKQICLESGISIKKIYAEKYIDGERVYNDIS